MLQIVFGRFYRQIKKKHNNDVIMTSFHVVGISKSQFFVKLNIGYHPSKLQIFWLSGSNFMEVSARPPKHHYDVIMMSFLIIVFPN